MLAKDIADNKAIGGNGAKEILSNFSGDNTVRILTHCNTGSLATAGYGTALGVIRSLHEMKRLGEISSFRYFISFQLIIYIYTYHFICLFYLLRFPVR